MMIDLETQKQIQKDIAAGKQLVEFVTVDEVQDTKCRIEQAARLVPFEDAEGDVVTRVKRKVPAYGETLSELYVCSDDLVKDVEGPIEAVQVACIVYPNHLVIVPVIAVRVNGEVYTSWENLT